MEKHNHRLKISYSTLLYRKRDLLQLIKHLQKKSFEKVISLPKKSFEKIDTLYKKFIYFTKMGRKLYYYHKDSGLEVDFVIRYNGECTLVEVKAAGGNVKSTKTILKYPGKYHINSAIKLGDYNVGRTEQILTLPLYMAFLLRKF